MKQVLAVCAFAWGGIAAELSRPDLFPAGAVLLPIAVTGMLWTRSGKGLFLAGLILLTDWIVRPAGPPLAPPFLTLAAAILLERQSARSRWGGHSPARTWIPEWTWPVALTIMGILLNLISSSLTSPQVTESLMPVLGRYALISIPVSFALAGLMGLAGEFGLRRGTAP